MQAQNLSHIETLLSAHIDPNLGCDLVSAKAVKNLTITGKIVQIDLVLGFPLQTILAAWTAELKAYLQAALPEYQFKISVRTQIETHVGQATIKALPQIKNIIAVASGKGGVGKSTVAVNLALGLAQEGAQVGLLDADIYGPSQPTMLGITGRPEIRDKKLIMPMVQYGIQMMSIGLLVDETAAMVWRGPMISMALQQLLNDTQWQGLDYLVVDLPPGTGDIQLTMAQKMPVSGAIIVTTPQELALIDVRRACAMFDKLTVPILGVVENMAGHVCSHCGHEDALFGAGGAEKLAEDFKVEMLASFALDKSLRQHTDNGKPTVIAEPDSSLALQYRKLARRAAAQLSLKTKSYSHKFPDIKVEKS